MQNLKILITTIIILSLHCDKEKQIRKSKNDNTNTAAKIENNSKRNAPKKIPEQFAKEGFVGNNRFISYALIIDSGSSMEMKNNASSTAGKRTFNIFEKYTTRYNRINRLSYRGKKEMKLFIQQNGKIVFTQKTGTSFLYIFEVNYPNLKERIQTIH